MPGDGPSAFAAPPRAINAPPMGRKRLEPGAGTGKSARIYVPVTDTQRRALTDLSAKTGRSTAALTRQALDAFLAEQLHEEVAQAS
jgi:hypothetical protein